MILAGGIGKLQQKCPISEPRVSPVPLVLQISCLLFHFRQLYTPSRLRFRPPQLRLHFRLLPLRLPQIHIHIHIIFIYLYTHTHTHTHTCIYIYIYIYTYVYIYSRRACGREGGGLDQSWINEEEDLFKEHSSRDKRPVNACILLLIRHACILLRIWHAKNIHHVISAR